MNPLEGLRETGGLPFFLPKGALTHNPEGAVVLPAAIVRSPRGIAAAAAASRQCHSICGCCCHRLRDWTNTVVTCAAIYPTACANLPLAALPQRWAVRSHRPFSLLDYIAGLIYKPKGVTDPKDAFAHLDKLIPSRENAFLLRDRSFEERAVVEGYHIKADTPDGK